jgi:hypothetical protein
VLGRLEPTLFLRRPYLEHFPRSLDPEFGSP